MEKYGLIQSTSSLRLEGYEVVGELRKIIVKNYAEIRQRTIYTRTAHAREFGVGALRRQS